MIQNTGFQWPISYLSVKLKLNRISGQTIKRFNHINYPSLCIPKPRVLFFLTRCLQNLVPYILYLFRCSHLLLLFLPPTPILKPSLVVQSLSVPNLLLLFISMSRFFRITGPSSFKVSLGRRSVVTIYDTHSLFPFLLFTGNRNCWCSTRIVFV